LFGLALVLLFRIVSSFLIPVMLGGFLVVLCHPLYDALAARGRLSPSLAAMLSTGAVLVAIFLPLGLMGYWVGTELVALSADGRAMLARPDFHEALRQHLPPFVSQVLTAIDPSGQKVDAALTGMLQDGGRVITSLIQTTTELAAGAFLMIITMYYLFMDGRRLFAELVRTVPLKPAYLHHFAREFRDVAHAMIYGTAVTAVLQGLTGYVGLLLAHVPHPHLWAVVMLAVAFIPVGGTALVWGPAAIYLSVNGHLAQGLFLAAWGVGMVGVMDNLLRPRLCGSKLDLHPLLVFLSMFGGFEVFGMAGLLIGPLVASLFMAMVHIYREDFLKPARARAAVRPRETPSVVPAAGGGAAQVSAVMAAPAKS
jgi:predicted PurR-regulated permease PerM